jgi:hypothetical protein
MFQDVFFFPVVPDQALDDHDYNVLQRDTRA